MELAELAQNNFGDTRTGSLAGPIGAFIIVALAVTTVLLIRNMNARIRRLPDRFAGSAERPEPSDRGPGGDSGGGADPDQAPDWAPDRDTERRTG